MQRTRIKICGITRLEDALAAVSAGADAIGFVFWEQSKRAITIDQARQICEQLPPFVTTVALLVNADPDFIDTLLENVPVDMVQFHGDETPEECGRVGKPFIKAIRMRDGLDITSEIELFSTVDNVRGILLDAYREGVPGGTGECFDWNLIPSQYCSRIILAGGLKATNVGLAVNTVKPYAVDVSGGVESAPGIKDVLAIQQFVAAVQSSD